MKQMACHVNFGILVWWGKFVDIGIVGFRFLYDVMSEQSEAIRGQVQEFQTTVRSISTACFLLNWGLKSSDFYWCLVFQSPGK
jgi:hypothetical protein